MNGGNVLGKLLANVAGDAAQAAQPSKLVQLAKLYGSPDAMSDDLRGTASRFFDETGLRGRQVYDEIGSAYPGINPHEAVRRLFSENSIDAAPQAAAVDNYFMGHRPREDGPRAFNLTEAKDEYGDNLIPMDMYDQWYGTRSGNDWDAESIAALKAIRDNPEALVDIYRASPKNELNPGDWVTLSNAYANQHASSNGSRAFTHRVPAKDLRWAMDDINEFGYFPEVGL
jgi:hypothetical protein